MEKKTLPYGRQTITDADVEAVVRALRSDWLTQGPEVTGFEKALCAALGATHATAVANGTAALHLIGLALGWKSGDLVLTTPLTFVASANCALYCGAEVGLVDIDPGTYTLDPEALAQKLKALAKAGRKVKAVVAVDYAGHPCDWPALRALADEHGFQLVEDACHALGARLGGESVCSGKWADAVALSFHPVKHLTTGEGGAVLTRDAELDRRVRRLRTHGITRDASELETNEGPWWYEMQDLGFNYRITDIQCALGSSQLSRLPDMLSRRQAIAMRYDAAFEDDDRFIIPEVESGAEHAYHLYPLQIRFEALKTTRKEAFERLKGSGIHPQVHYIPVHFQPYYRQRFGFKKGDFPHAELFYSRELSIPMYSAMELEDADRVASEVKRVLR